MTFLLILLVLICLWGIRFPGFRNDFMSPKNTMMIKGVFFLLFVIPISLLLAEGLSILYKLIDTRLFANA